MDNTNESGVSLTTTAVGWAAIFAAVGGAAYLTSQRRKPGQTVAPKKTHSQPSEPKKEKSAKKQRLNNFHSDTQDGSKGKAKTYADAVTSASRNNFPVNAADTSDDGVDNAEFARQIANVREGTKFGGKDSAEKKKKQKALKQSQAAKTGANNAVQEASATSSTTGADADDDQSPIMSPELTAVDASGVNDMLEPAPAGPSVLRIVGTDKVKPQQPKKAKEPEKTETKKQRQQRKKRELEKAQAQVNEAKRKIQEEEQRRRAREARGEHAKDGSQFMAHINGKKPSAWGEPAQNGGAMTSASSDTVRPLDTYDVSTSSNASTTNEASPPLADSWATDLPSEEEQIKKLTEMEEWNTVSTKASKRGQKKPPTPVAEAPSTVPPAPAAPATTGSNTSRPQKPLPSFGSFSALSRPDAEEDQTPKAAEQEVEWDV